MMVAEEVVVLARKGQAGLRNKKREKGLVDTVYPS